MRLWSIHPKYLDSKGLVALWREGLLAKKSLEEKTKGYRNHPQLNRFKDSPKPLEAINSYLYYVFLEAVKRGYNFNIKKISLPQRLIFRGIPVKYGQVEFEFYHLLKKLRLRNKNLHNYLLKSIKRNNMIVVNPLFCLVPGEIEEWEKFI